MPLTPPPLDSRTYDELLDDALARIPVHNPEWTNFNESDPGVTIVELFAFLTENLLYRANQIPERNRRKFLSLLGVPLQPPSSARGLVQIVNDRGPLETVTLNSGIELRAGNVPFRTDATFDVLPVEGRVYAKRKRSSTDDLVAYYRQLYSALEADDVQLYETAPLEQQGSAGVAFDGTVDNSVWIALLLRQGDRPSEATLREAREAIAGKTVSIGVVPALDPGAAELRPTGRSADDASHVRFLLPKIPRGGGLTGDRRPSYRLLDASASADVLVHPGVVQVELPGADELVLWNNVEPLEGGTGDLPPALEDSQLAERVITWLRMQLPVGAQATLLWAGINVVAVAQRAHVENEVLPDGTGEPDQVVKLARTPVLPGSAALTVTAGGVAERWTEIDDLLAAGPEIPVPDLRAEPGVPPPAPAPANVFVLDPEAGELRFGDGLRGRRPPLGATMRVSYAYGLGREGNVARAAISAGPALPAGFKVSNPVRTWGGAEGETVAEGEKQVARYLQHRDRLVTAEDFDTIVRRTPGIDLGRIEVLPAYNPNAATPEVGEAPGAVTLLVIPRYDPVQPDAPLPDNLFVESICDYIEPRRLVTTEVFLRGPTYKSIWITVGIDVVAGASIPQARDDVRRALMTFLSPLPTAGERDGGWPLRKAVAQLELQAVASRVGGVRLVNGLQVAAGTDAPQATIPLAGLELPRVVGISVVAGDPLDLDQLRGLGAAAPGTPVGPGGDGTTGPVVVPVPVVPETC